MFTLPSNPGENSTYHLQFRSSHFKCRTAQYNSTLKLNHKRRKYLEAPKFATAWDRVRLAFSSKQYDIANYTVQRNLSSGLVWEATCVVKEQICTAESVLYSVNVSFPRGIQTVTHSFSDPKTLPRRQAIDVEGGGSVVSLDLPPETQAYQNFYRELSTAIPVSNEWAILEALGGLIEGTLLHVGSIPSRLLPLPNHPPLEPRLEQGYNSGWDCHQREGSTGPTPVYDCGVWTGEWSGYEELAAGNCKSFPLTFAMMPKLNDLKPYSKVQSSTPPDSTATRMTTTTNRNLR